MKTILASMVLVMGICFVTVHIKENADKDHMAIKERYEQTKKTEKVIETITSKKVYFQYQDNKMATVVFPHTTEITKQEKNQVKAAVSEKLSIAKENVILLNKEGEIL